MQTVDPPRVRVAVVQASSIPFDIEASIDKSVDLIREISRKGVDLILFPEAFIPGYPRGMAFGCTVGARSPEGRNLWMDYWKNAVSVPDRWTERIGKAARQASVYVALGVIEKVLATRGTLYCTLLYFGRNGQLIGRHRKLKPTGSERLIWGEGGGESLIVLDTEIGRIGGLFCWENYMPLARMALYRYGVQIFLAPTADARDTWQATITHIACEGRCFVLGCNQYVTRDMVASTFTSGDELASQPEIMCRGGSAIVSPFGQTLAGPLYNEEGILYAELDLGETIRGKFDFDVAGHYSRSDVFTFSVDGQPIPIPYKPTKKEK